MFAGGSRGLGKALWKVGDVVLIDGEPVRDNPPLYHHLKETVGSTDALGVLLWTYDATWHASQANPWSVGIECAQSADTPDLTRAQVDACVAVVRAICEALNIPRRVPVR